MSDDLLQIVCGRRADFINIRRESLLRQISEEFHRDVLHKIPPSSETLFNEDSVQKYLTKIGGAERLTLLSRPVPQNLSKDIFYQNQRPSTSKQADSFFRQNTSAKRKRHLPHTPNKTKVKSNCHGKRVGRKTQSDFSFKSKNRQ